jgi:hypothetical protein
MIREHIDIGVHAVFGDMPGIRKVIYFLSLNDQPSAGALSGLIL